jgi:hypothetical protein
MGMRGGAVFHSSSISTGVRAWAWLTRSLMVALQGQGFGGEGAGGLDGADVFVPQCVKAGRGLVSIVSTPHAGRLQDTCTVQSMETWRKPNQ